MGYVIYPLQLISNSPKNEAERIYHYVRKENELTETD